MARNERRRFLTALGGVAALTRHVGASAGAETAPVGAGLQAQRLSWAGLRLEAPGLSLVLDAWSNAGGWGGAWKEPVVPIEASSRRRFALVSHLHNDHFDAGALKELLGQNGVVVCHESMAAVVSGRGFRVRPTRLWEPEFVDDAVVTAVPAVDGLNHGQVSWVVVAGGRRILHGGDTLWHGAWWQIRQLGPFDAVFLPINGARLADPKPESGQPISLTPEQAVAAARVLAARLLVPIHYGMNDPGSYAEVPDAVETLVKEARRQGVTAQVVAPGAWIEWPA